VFACKAVLAVSFVAGATGYIAQTLAIPLYLVGVFMAASVSAAAVFCRHDRNELLKTLIMIALLMSTLASGVALHVGVVGCKC
jgi:hypothetical protein